MPTIEEEALAKLERWLESRERPPTIFEVIETGDIDLFAAFILAGFRSTARQTVLERLLSQRRALDFDKRLGASAVLCVADFLSREWRLTAREMVGLLGLQDTDELQRLKQMSLTDLPIAVIERLAILADIFATLNILVPGPGRAGGWLRALNNAPTFQGRSALQVMLDGLSGLRNTRAFLLAQRWVT